MSDRGAIVSVIFLFVWIGWVMLDLFVTYPEFSDFFVLVLGGCALHRIMVEFVNRWKFERELERLRKEF